MGPRRLAETTHAGRHLESELVDAKTVGRDVPDVRGDAVVPQIVQLERAVRVQGRHEFPRALSADVVMVDDQGNERRVVSQDRRERPRAFIADGIDLDVQARERRVVVQGRRERARAFSADVVCVMVSVVSVALLA